MSVPVLIASGAVAGTTVPVPDHQPGDVIIVFAFRNGSTTAPSLGTGFRDVFSGGANSCAGRVGLRVCQGTTDDDDPITGWTNATHLHYTMWRGCDLLNPVGAFANTGGVGTTVTLPTITLQRTDGTSRIYSAFGHSAGTTFGTAPSLMSELQALSGPPASRSYATDAAVTSWGGVRTVSASPSGNYRVFSLEVRGAVTPVAGLWQSHIWYSAKPVNVMTVLELDYALGHVSAPFDPTEDDDHLRNDVTVERTGGSSGRFSVQDGPLSVSSPPDGVGVYNESVALNLATDGQLLDQASWRAYLGTVNEPRYPNVTVSLTRNPDLQEVVGQVESGGRMLIHNPPAWLPPGDIDLLVQGYVETISPTEWTWTANTTPASPWTVAVVDNDDLDRVDTDGSELTSAIDSDDTSVSVTITGTALWVDTTDYPDEFPFLILVSGEVMRVTGISGSASPQTFTVERSINGVVKSHSAGTAVSLAVPAIIAL